MDEWLSWLGGAALLALGAGFGWAGSFLTNRQAAKEAARIRDELRRHEQERGADSAVRARNRETRQAIEALMELADEGFRLFDSMPIRDDWASNLRFNRICRRVQARLRDDSGLSALVATLESLHGDRGRLSNAIRIDPEIPDPVEQLPSLMTKLSATHRSLAEEMERRDLPW